MDLFLTPGGCFPVMYIDGNHSTAQTHTPFLNTSPVVPVDKS